MTKLPALVLALAGLAVSAGLGAAPPQRISTLDDLFVGVAKIDPDFGGMFLRGDEPVLHVYLLDPSPDGVKAVEAAITKVFGRQIIPKGGVKALQGRYGFLQLKQWYDRMRGSVLVIKGVTLTDIDEAKNRLRIGIKKKEYEARVIRQVEKQKIPREAVVIEVTGPIMPVSHTLLQLDIPTVGGLQIMASPSNKTCSLGFNATTAGKRGFVTASHCTNTQGGAEGTTFGQPGASPPVATEILDPLYWTGFPCPPGMQCRYSDSAFAEYGPLVLATQGTVARTTAITTSALNPIWTIDHNKPRFFILGTATTLSGATLNKVGRTSGWSQGQVMSTCFDTNVANSTLHLLCQYHLGGNAQVQPGDSGSPVFGIVDLSKGTARLHGVLWGRYNNQNFVFSDFGHIQQELGLLKPEYDHAPKNNLYFKGTDSRIYNYWWDGNGKWRLDPLDLDFNVTPAIAAGDIALHPSVGHVYFRGTDNRVYNHWWTGTTWQLDWLGPAQIAAGELVVNTSGDHLFFRGTDNRVYNYWWTGTTWQLDWLGPAQIAAGNLVVNPSGDHVFFRGTDNRVYNYWWTGTAWQLDWLGPAQIAAGDLVVNTSGDHVFFRGTDSRVYNYWWAGTGWNLDWLGPAQIAAGDLVVNTSGDHVFFRGTDTRVYNYWWAGTGWNLDWLGPAQIAAGNLVLWK